VSAENVDLVRGLYERLAQGDFWSIAPLLDPEIEWEWSPKLATLAGGQRVYSGLEAVGAATKEWLEAWEWAAIEAEELHDAGDRVVSFARTRARPKHGGPEMVLRTAEVWTVRGGLVTRYIAYDDRDEALASVSLK
jgi:ketosteroid isomerase-like protein